MKQQSNYTYIFSFAGIAGYTHSFEQTASSINELYQHFRDLLAFSFIIDKEKNDPFINYKTKTDGNTNFNLTNDLYETQFLYL